MIKMKIFPFIALLVLLQSCCNCKDTVKEKFRYGGVKMEQIDRAFEVPGVYFLVKFERLPPTLQAAGMGRCNCEALVLESPLAQIRFVRTDASGSALEDISHRFAGRNYYGAPEPLYKSLPVLVAEFREAFTHNNLGNNDLIFVDMERSASEPVLFYAELEFENGQILQTETLTSL